MKRYYFDQLNNDSSLLSFKDLRISFHTNEGTLKAVRGVSLDLKKGQTLALVGESGSGKSVCAKATLGVLASNKIIEEGHIIYNGYDLLHLSDKEISSIRGNKIAMIFQDPLSALNPIVKIGKQLEESFIIKQKRTRKEARAKLRYLNKAMSSYHGSLENELVTMLNNSFSTHLDYLKDYLNSLLDLSILYFESINKFSYLDVKAYINNLYKQKDRFQYQFRIENDNYLDNAITSLNLYINEFSKAIILEKKTKDLFEEYGVSSYYELPLEIRKKEKEVLITPLQIFSKMKDTLEGLIKYLKEYIEVISFSKDEYANAFLSYYQNLLKEARQKTTKKELKEKCISLLNDVGIDNPSLRYEQYPFELSGGMRQRVVIAISLSLDPEILICDEPTTALDVTIQAQILDLINELKIKKNLSLIFITHDLGVVANIADEIAIMYAGKIVEKGSVYDIFYDPRHPYTWGLLSSIPSLSTETKLESLPSSLLDMHTPPKGDAFARRNKYALEIDYKEFPPRFDISASHYAYTWLLHKDAKKVIPPEILTKRIQTSLSENKNNIPSYHIKKNSILNSIKKKGD